MSSLAASRTAGRRRKREEKRKESRSDQHGDLNDEFSYVYARMVHLLPLAPHWRNSSVLADESESECGIIDTSPCTCGSQDGPLHHTGLACLVPVLFVEWYRCACFVFRGGQGRS
jgi:hypothetical protein